jgi:hypothetical protein
VTTDANGNSVRYGIVNTDMMRRWVRLAPEEDGPFWALNLMKYRETAEYADGRAATVSGREADDEYTPRDSLTGIGATIVFAADVESVLSGDGTRWDRIGIVRYPSRRAFMEMQRRDDFKRQHVHKDAGMEFTIVMSCLPVTPFAGRFERRPYVELSVTETIAATASDTAVFDVEGVIVGDERAWTQASFRWLDDPTARGEPLTGDRSVYRMLLRPTIDRLTASVLDAQPAPSD